MKDYFSHDYNARNDRKLANLVMKHGMAGLGTYWCVTEMLYEERGVIPVIDCERIAFELRTTLDLVNSVIRDFELFSIVDGKITNESVKKRLVIREEKSSTARKSAEKRWNDGNQELREKAKSCIFYILKIFSDDEVFIKVGVTSDSVTRRYSGKLNGYKYELLYRFDTRTSDALRIEQEILKKFAKYSAKINFPGSLECLEISNQSEIINFAMRQCESANASKEKESKEKESSLPPKSFPQESTEYKLSFLLFDFIKKNNPAHRFHNLNISESEKQIQKYAHDVDLILRVDKRDPKLAEALIAWSQTESRGFWKSNILSMSKFREQFDTLAAQAKREFNDSKKFLIPKE